MLTNNERELHEEEEWLREGHFFLNIDSFPELSSGNDNL